MAFWHYTVCIGGDAHQWHAEAGIRVVEHHIGRAQAPSTELNRLVFGGGHAGRSAELLIFCWEAPSEAPSRRSRGYSLVVHETQPLQYQMTLFHPAACATQSSPPKTHGLLYHPSIPHLWGECFESVGSDAPAHEPQLHHPQQTPPSHASWRSRHLPHESPHALPHLKEGERRTVPPERQAAPRARAAGAAALDEGGGQGGTDGGPGSGGGAGGHAGSAGGGSGGDGRGEGGGQRGSRGKGVGGGDKGGGGGKRGITRGEEVGRGDTAQRWPRHLQACTEQWFGLYSLPALLCVCARDMRAALLLLLLLLLLQLLLLLLLPAAIAGSREEPHANAFLGGRRSSRVEAAAATDTDADTDAAADADADADFLLGWGRAEVQQGLATPVEVVGVPVSEGQAANAPVVKGVPLTRGAFGGNDPPASPLPPPPERPWLLEWAASSSGESDANNLRPRRAQGRRGGGDSDGTTMRTVAQHSSLLHHRGGVSSRRATRGDATRAAPPPTARRRRATRDAVAYDA